MGAECALCHLRVLNAPQDRQCIVVVGGCFLEGWVAVWKYPMLLPSGMQLWCAVAPEAYPLVPRNAIVCTQRGPGLTDMSGSGYDGDEACWSTDPLLLQVLRASGEGPRDLFAKAAEWVEGYLGEGCRDAFMPVPCSATPTGD